MNLISSRKFDSADSWDMEIVLNASKTEITTQEKTVLVSKQGENVQDRYFREPDTGSTLLSHQEKLPISCLFYKSHTKARIVVLSLAQGQEKILCEQVNVALCV